MKLKSLKKFIAAVEKKYGKSALEFRVELLRPIPDDGKVLQHRGETVWEPHDLDYLGVDTYPKDKENDYPKERVVVIR